MKWSEIRPQYPNKWLLIEINRRADNTPGSQSELTVIEVHDSAPPCVQRYVELHGQSPGCDLEVVDTREYALLNQLRVCAYCSVVDVAEDYFWRAHASWCASCMRQFRQKRWMLRGRHERDTNERCYRLNKRGVAHLPQHETVTYCPQDGMEIYRRWIEAGIATMDACPYCHGQKVSAQRSGSPRDGDH